MNDSPYAAAALALLQAGWRGILPLPPKAKKFPPRGYTGSDGVDPSGADIHTWAEHHQGNIALRMPPDCIGVDVDAYGQKQGALTMRNATLTWGPLPPTWRSTSRDDGVSGIAMYRVPQGLAWPGEVGPGVDILQHRHRYAVAPPSIHPEGRAYRWIDPDGVVSLHPPRPDQLPALPQAWVVGLTGGAAADITRRGDTTYQQAVTWFAERVDPRGTPCQRMREEVDDLSSSIPGNAHNTARSAVATLARLAEGGHRGAATTALALKELFITEATNPRRAAAGLTIRTPSEAEREWVDLVVSAVDLVIHNPNPGDTCDCDGALTAFIVGPEHQQEGEAPSGVPQGYVDGATFIFDQPALETRWGDGERVLWAQGEALLIAGPPGVGKTTLTGQIVRELIGLGQGDLLDLTIAPAARVLYLAMDRPRQIARSLRRHFRPDQSETIANKLLVWEGPPPQDLAKNSTILTTMAKLVGADVVIVDSLKDAVVGLTDDTIAAGYNRARQTLLAAGIDLLELHHMRKAGDNGSKPNTLADVYGSAWLTAGIGSCIVLWGKAGDPIVELLHLKTPIDDVGPLRLTHDHSRGVTGLVAGFDPLSVAHSLGGWFTASDFAAAYLAVETPTRADVEKARRRLDKLTRDGELAYEPGAKGGGNVSRWCTVIHAGSRASETPVTGYHAAPDPPTNPSHGEVTRITKDSRGHGGLEESPRDPLPGATVTASLLDLIQACRNHCGRTTVAQVQPCQDCQDRR